AHVPPCRVDVWPALRPRSRDPRECARRADGFGATPANGGGLLQCQNVQKHSASGLGFCFSSAVLLAVDSQTISKALKASHAGLPKGHVHPDFQNSSREFPNPAGG